MPKKQTGPDPDDQSAPSPGGNPDRPPTHIAASPADLRLFAEQSPRSWETGETPGGERIPGTRRLWLAGALAGAVIVSCVTTLALMDNSGDDPAAARDGRTTSAGDPVVPSITVGASGTGTGTAEVPGGKSGLSSPKSNSAEPDSAGSASATTEQHGSGAKSVPDPSKPAAKPSKPSGSDSGSGSGSGSGSDSSSESDTTWKSFQAVNYPDRYWHLSDSAVRLDPVSSGSGSETRADSTFKVVSGLAKSSCYSFATNDGRYLRHRNFLLRADRNDGSDLFQKDATFCPVPSRQPGAVMLESVNYPGRFLRHRNFAMRLDPYGYNTANRADFSFRMVQGLG